MRNNMKRYLLIMLSCFVSYTMLHAQNDLKLLREGNKDYKNAKYNEAEINYRKALEKNSRNYKSLYNLGSALYKQGNYEEAANILNDLSEQKLDDKTLSNIYHNLGNALLKNEKYAESIDAYKKSLRLNSKDMDTKYNLSYALSKLQQQQNSSCDNKDEQNKDENKEQQQQEQQQQEQQQKEQQQKEQQQQQQQPKDEISKEEAERMLNALKKEEENVKDKVDKQVQPAKIIIEKDW